MRLSTTIPRGMPMGSPPLPLFHAATVLRFYLSRIPHAPLRLRARGVASRSTRKRPRKHQVTMATWATRQTTRTACSWARRTCKRNAQG